MTPYLSSSSPAFRLELNEDPHNQHFGPDPQASSSSSLSCHIFFNTTQLQSGYYHRELQLPQHHQQQGGSYDQEDEIDNGLKLSIWRSEDRNENQSENNPVKWMSSKMRLMQKMKNSYRMGAGIPTNTTLNSEDQKHLSSPLETDTSSNTSSNISSNPIRVCADCSTTKTPLWRSGPRGPKSLCNACGIRQRKARRAIAAAAAAANGTILPTETLSMKTKGQHKEKRSNVGHVTQYKKGCKLVSSSSHGRKKLCFEDFLLRLSKNLACHSVFPQDEKEAAILLMALSCGVVRG